MHMSVCECVHVLENGKLLSRAKIGGSSTSERCICVHRDVWVYMSMQDACMCSMSQHM